MKTLALLFTVLAAVGCSKNSTETTTPSQPAYGQSYRAPADQPLSEEISQGFQTAWNAAGEATDEVIDSGEYTFHHLKNGGVEVWNRTKQVAGQAGEEVGDAAVLSAVKSRIETTNGVRQQGIDVDVDDGVVSLHGDVPSRQAAGTAIGLALNTRGVDRVVSYLTWPGMSR